MNTRRILHWRYTEGSPLPLIHTLIQHLHLTESQVSHLIHLGAIYVNFIRTIDPHTQVLPGSILRIHLQPRRYPKEQLKKIEVLYDTPDWIWIYKPWGIPTHETLDNIQENAKAYIANLIAHRELHPLYRLDVGTAGLLGFAKNAQTKAHWDKMKDIKKIYLALTEKGPRITKGTYTHWMEKSARAPKRILSIPEGLDPGGYQRCQLVILKAQAFDDYNLYLIKLVTGRTHQIRAQLAYLGQPILGDKMYGSTHSFISGALVENWSLCCYQIRLSRTEFFRIPQRLINRDWAHSKLRPPP